MVIQRLLQVIGVQHFGIGIAARIYRVDVGNSPTNALSILPC